MAQKIIRNLQIGVTLSLIILISSSIASYISIKRQMENRENVSKTRRSITAAKDVMISLLDAETGNRGFQITGNEHFLEPYNRGLKEFPKAMEDVRILQTTNKTQLNRIDSLQHYVNARMGALTHFVENKRKGQEMTQEQMLISKGFMDKCREIVASFVDYEEKELDIQNKDLNKSTSITFIFLLLSGLSAVIVTGYLYFKLKKDIIRRDKLEKRLRQKEQEIATRVKVIQQIANKVANGDYSQRAVDNEQDNLGELVYSLNHMTDSLKKSFDEINKSDWRQKGLAILNESLVGNKSVKEISNTALTHLIEYGSCANGAIYLADDNKLKLFSAFGLEKSMKESFDPGEGMVGQVFLQKQSKVFNDLKDDDFVVSFAINQLKINGIILIPILLGKQSLGILELNSGSQFEKDRVDFLVESCRILGVAIAAAKGREQEQKLLEETQAQSEELQVQHSELENLNTELEAQTQKLQASEEELRVQQEELMQSNAELEERSKLLEEKNHLIAERNIEIQRKAEELELSTKYKSEFLANMSHELRTPLNSILLLSRLMSEDPDENLNEDQIESAKVIQSSGSSLLTLIDEILDLAKIESGKMNLDYQNVIIDDVVTDLRNLFNPLIQEKGLQFNISIDDELQKELETDRLRVDQVLRNLMSNALKFTSEGSIDLTIKKDIKNENYIIFSVKDTGIGIPEDKQKVIFEAFQQADGSTRRKFGGTGLGLSISREITKLLGGELLLTSKVGEGSEFSLSIPMTPKLRNNNLTLDESPMEVIREDVKVIQKIIDYKAPNYDNTEILKIPEDVPDDRDNIGENDKVILIVEDDVNFAKALVKYAHTQSYKAVVMVRGDYALSAALQYHPLAILLDVQLPVKDGWQVMDELKSNFKVKHIPVHMMSSLHVKQESLMKGAIDFINKPIALEQMSVVFKKIEEALSRSLQKVLIVEENAKHATALSYFLSNFNISASVEDNAEDCVRAFSTNMVDCVILNVEDSRGEEYAIIESIKKHEGLDNLPVIIFIDRNLSQSEELKIKQYADSIVVKTAHSYQRILDEVGLFLHLVEEKNNTEETRGNNTLGALTEVLSGKKILITDDDVRNIFSLTKVLEKYKVEVVLAMDGKQALEQMKEHPDIDVILMDMMMPEMDGYQTIREIRKQPKLSRLPIIAVTAKSMIGEREKCIEAGASDYISKPVDTDQLLSLLRVWLYEN